MWPTIIPQKSPRGNELCTVIAKSKSTNGRYGAVNEKSPRNDSIVSGCLRDQTYTKIKDNGAERNGCEIKGDSIKRNVDE